MFRYGNAGLFDPVPELVAGLLSIFLARVVKEIYDDSNEQLQAHFMLHAA